MKQITREEAEQLIFNNEVVSSILNQDKNELCIKMNLSNKFECLVKYDIHTHNKTYFIFQLENLK